MRGCPNEKNILELMYWNKKGVLKFVATLKWSCALQSLQADLRVSMVELCVKIRILKVHGNRSQRDRQSEAIGHGSWVGSCMGTAEALSSNPTSIQYKTQKSS